MKKFLLIFSVISIAVFWFIAGTIPQDEAYHDFADCRKMSGIPYAFDVLSNLPFLFFGVYGIYQVLKNRPIFTSTFWMYMTFFIFVFFVGIGSGYYHWHPDSKTLVWDRLPMSVAFMAMTAFIVAEFSSITIAKKLFPPLLIAGMGSVVYWALVNDFRPYEIVQFFPLVCCPIILWKD